MSSMTNYKELESILRCPLTRSELSLLNDSELQMLKSRVLGQELRSCHPSFDRGVWQGAFKAAKQDVYYLMMDDIVYLLPEFALQKQNVLRLAEHDNDVTKQSVKQFYDSFGWQQESGVFQDALDSEDLREVSKDYIEKCHARLKQYLPVTGRYLLDVASGPIQYDAYLAYSQDYDYRICADISLRALQAAKQKLGAKGLYLLSDITRLPLQTGKIDAVVSLHTLYHVPKEQQLQGYTEIQRVLKSKGRSIVIYSWGRWSLLMNIFMFPVKLASLLKRLPPAKQAEQSLYFYAHSHEWYRRHIQHQYACKLYAWRSVNVPFLKLFIHEKLGGRLLLKVFFWLENRFPRLMGRIGAYPLFVSTKP